VRGRALLWERSRIEGGFGKRLFGKDWGSRVGDLWEWVQWRKWVQLFWQIRVR
jgi:hypothetical protein